MSNETFTASLYPGSKLSIDAFTGGRNPTPGNVGICLCGGGSRALSAGMGQLRALNHLCTDNGATLLSQTKAISTVSGGSWLGISFEYQNRVSDDIFLNSYIANPGDLTTADIKQLPAGNIGQQVTEDFTVPDIALQALLYHLFAKTPANMLWQTVIGKHILSPYGLYEPAKENVPTQAFSYDDDTVRDILSLPNQNPALSGIPFLTLSGNSTRPYFICNTAMFVQGAEPDIGDYQYLAPVQCTPFFTGIVGKPGGTDVNGKQPGGGGVTSLAFNSILNMVDATSVTLNEQRPWSIMDSVGASSAAFAETLVNLLAKWDRDPTQFLANLQKYGSPALRCVQDELPSDEFAKAAQWLERLESIDATGLKSRDLLELIGGPEQEKAELRGALHALSLSSLVPEYHYWPVAGAAPDPHIQPTRFADGGNLENTGVASLLSYRDIDNVIAFVNSSTLLKPATASAPPPVLIDETTGVIITDIVVDNQIPPLFGYQPYSESKGTYTPYDGGSNLSKKTAWGVHNQVFPGTAFSELLSGIWGAAGGSKRPAIYKQELSVVANEWFGVAARECITCIWVYTSTVSDWEKQLNTDVKSALDGLKHFPNYGTLDTELSPTEINLLASLTAWSVANDNNKTLFIDLYRDK